MSRLVTEVSEDGPSVAIALIGELDIAEAPAVQEILADLERRQPPVLTLDLRRLSFLDSSGLRLILEADVRARTEGRRLFVVRGPDAVQRVFSISLLDKRLEFVDDPGDIQP